MSRFVTPRPSTPNRRAPPTPAAAHELRDRSKLGAGSQEFPSPEVFPGLMNETAASPAPASRRRRAAIGTVAALSTAGLTAGIAFGIGAPSGATPVAEQSSWAHVQPAANGFGGPGWPGGGGDGGYGYGWGYGNGSGSGSGSTGSTATSIEQAGIVNVTTVLGYQNAEAAGTGMILTSTGDVLTNNHVIADATSIKVTVASTGTSYTATVVGTDPSADVAVLHIDNASGLRTARLSTSPATVGDAVTAVGNAGGTGTLTAVSGTVTNLDQSITATDSSGGGAEQLSGLIETDAAVQPGDSGAPLYDEATGAVGGMATAASSGGPAQAYAIPISTAEAIAGQIERGVTSATIHQGYPAFLGGSIADGQTGATIAGVVSDGPAARAGLAAGDVITGVAGSTVASAEDLTAALAGHSPGQHVTVTWSDATGGSHSATVTLGTGPAD